MLEYFLTFFAGSLTFLLLVAILLKYSKLGKTEPRTVRQSELFLEIKSLMPEMISSFLNRPTQSQTYDNNRSFKFIEMSDKKVYWLDRNRLFYAEVKADGRFDPMEGKPSNMKNLSKKEVAKILYIYNSLKNG